MNKNNIVFPCLKITQPIGIFYVGVMRARDVVFVSKADVRKIEDDDIGRAIGIQRTISESRLKKIKAYVGTLDATFPTSIILAVEPEHANYDSATNRMTIKREEDIASVIDGQHRLKGLEDYVGEFELNVTIFVDMVTQDKANVFATINLAQTKVNKSLVYDLYDYASNRSPQKTCHEIAKLMNYEEDSPLYRKIKILGVATGHRSETITQATLVESLMELISSDPLKDRDDLKRKRKLKHVEGRQALKLCFRDFFIDRNDASIAKIVWNYFSAVAKRWEDAWEEKQTGMILNRTSGFRALIKFLRDVYVEIAKAGEVPSQKRFAKVFDGIGIASSSFTSDNYLPGTSGETKLLQDLRKKSGISDYSTKTI